MEVQKAKRTWYLKTNILNNLRYYFSFDENEEENLQNQLRATNQTLCVNLVNDKTICMPVLKNGQVMPFRFTYILPLFRNNTMDLNQVTDQMANAYYEWYHEYNNMDHTDVTITPLAQATLDINNSGSADIPIARQMNENDFATAEYVRTIRGGKKKTKMKKNKMKRGKKTRKIKKCKILTVYHLYYI